MLGEQILPVKRTGSAFIEKVVVRSTFSAVMRERSVTMRVRIVVLALVAAGILSLITFLYLHRAEIKDFQPFPVGTAPSYPHSSPFDYGHPDKCYYEHTCKPNRRF